MLTKGRNFAFLPHTPLLALCDTQLSRVRYITRFNQDTSSPWSVKPLKPRQVFALRIYCETSLLFARPMITDTNQLILYQLFALLIILSFVIASAVFYESPILLVGALLIAYIVTIVTLHKAYCLFITLLAPFPIKQEEEEPSLHHRHF